MITVVTGASGHIGAALVRALLEQGRTVRAICHRDTRAVDKLPVEIVRADVCVPDTLEKAFKGTDVVYHLAGCISLLLGDWPMLHKINVMGTRNVVTACLRNHVRRLVHFSSIHAMNQKPLDACLDETRCRVGEDHPAPYDRSKSIAEQFVRDGIEQGLDAVIIHPTGVIGPHDFQRSHTGNMLVNIAKGRVYILVRGGFDWVDVRDVAQGAILAEKKAKTGSCYILSGHWAPVTTIAGYAAQYAGRKAPGLVLPLWLAKAALPIISLATSVTKSRPVYTRFTLDTLESNRNISCEKARTELGYSARPLRDTIYDTLQWFEEHGYLLLPSR